MAQDGPGWPRMAALWLTLAPTPGPAKDGPRWPRTAPDGRPMVNAGSDPRAGQGRPKMAQDGSGWPILAPRLPVVLFLPNLI
jgi:hypothetical protein